MTKKQEAKLKEMEEFINNGVPKKAKAPSSDSDELHIDVIDMKQKENEMDKKKFVEVPNGKDVQTVLSAAGIQLNEGGYDNLNKKQSKREINKDEDDKLNRQRRGASSGR